MDTIPRQIIIILSLQHWTKLAHRGGLCPGARSGHAAVCLDFGGENPQLVVIGGLDFSCKTLKDIWMLDIKSGGWVQVSISNYIGIVAISLIFLHPQITFAPVLLK